LQQGPGAISLDACQPHPAVMRMTTACATSSAKNATPCCSVTSVSRAPPPQVGSVRGPRPVVSAEVLAMTSRNSRPRFLALSAGSGSSLPSSAWPSSLSPVRFLPRLASGARWQHQSAPSLAAVAHAQKALPLAVALRVLRLSPARFHAWASPARDCPLDDRPSCPHTSPSQLTAKEISDMRDMVISDDYRHMTIRALALHAQRTGKVFASPSTWSRLARERGWLSSTTPPLPGQTQGRHSRAQTKTPIGTST